MNDGGTRANKVNFSTRSRHADYVTFSTDYGSSHLDSVYAIGIHRSNGLWVWLVKLAQIFQDIGGALRLVTRHQGFGGVNSRENQGGANPGAVGSGCLCPSGHQS